MNDLIDKLREAIFKPSPQAQQAQENWFKNYPHEQGWKQNSDGSYDVKGSVDLSDKGWTKLPWKFRRVGEDFFCDNNLLTTLEGAPQHVGGDVFCTNNRLTTLEGAPQHVDGSFYCDYNQLITLKGAPQRVGRSFFCDSNQLTTLQGAPQYVGGSFSCYSNQLTSLEGAPQHVGEHFSCGNNPKSARNLKTTVKREYFQE